jgi:DNA-binding transcriptional ArsR family regulator
MEKNIKFTDDELVVLAEDFKMLSEPSRLKILRALFSGEKCVTEIIENTGLLQANVSKQLKILQRNGVVACRPAGLQRFYKIHRHLVLDLLNIAKDK